MAQEFRIMAYFTAVYQPRSYKGHIYTTYEDARKEFPEAYKYYQGYKYLYRVQIEARSVSKWKKI